MSRRRSKTGKMGLRFALICGGTAFLGATLIVVLLMQTVGSHIPADAQEVVGRGWTFGLAIALVVAVATATVALLVFYLSLQLRQGERYTLARIGASRLQVQVLMATEVICVLLLSACLAAVLIMLTRHYGMAVLQQLLLT